MNPTRIRTLQVLNTVAFAAMVYVNYLSNALPINGKTPGELSDQYPNLFTPAGLTFSVWGLIYFTTFLFVGYQASSWIRPAWRERIDPLVRQVDTWFVQACLCNIGWLFAWHYEKVEWSVVIMVTYLVHLIVIDYLIRDYGRRPIDKWLVRLPFGLHLGWISIALIANVTALLVYWRWDANGWPPEVWAVVMVGVGTLLTLGVLRRVASVPYALVVVWAFIGIILKRTQQPADPNQPILIMAGVGIGLILIGTMIRWPEWGKR
jgi:hypothetical protein